MKYLSQRNFGQKSEIVCCALHTKRLCNNNEKTRSEDKKGLETMLLKRWLQMRHTITPSCFQYKPLFQAGFLDLRIGLLFQRSVSPLTMLKTMWWAAISLWYDFVSASCFWPDGTFLKEGSDKTYFLALSSPSRPPHFHKLNYCWFTICISFTCTAQWFRFFADYILL